MNPGLIGGIAGSLIGVAGGVIGTYFSIKNTNSKAERMLMVKASVIFWTAGIAFVALLLILPPLYRWFLWIPYGILFPIGIITINKKQQRIRNRVASPEENPPRPTGDETDIDR